MGIRIRSIAVPSCQTHVLSHAPKGAPGRPPVDWNANQAYCCATRSMAQQQAPRSMNHPTRFRGSLEMIRTPTNG